jgi:hypothetical protein
MTTPYNLTKTPAAKGQYGKGPAIITNMALVLKAKMVECSDRNAG